MSTGKPLPIDPGTLRALAVEFSVHPRSLEKALRGGSLRGLCGHRVRSGLAKHGLSHLAPHLTHTVMGSVPDQPGVVVSDDEDEDDTHAIAV